MRRPMLAMVLACTAVGVVSAQHNLQKGQGSPPPGPEPTNSSPFSLTVHGAFRNMVREQDYSPKVQLRAIMHRGATEAVGAVARLRGEITAIDGRLLVTYGTPCESCAHAAEEHATLLVSAKITAWHEPMPLPSTLVGRDLDTFIIDRAKATGVDVGKPFPVRLKGTLTDVRMHVVRAPNAGFTGHGSAHAMADQENIVAERIDGEVVGFYAPETMQGVITHPGEHFHYHWVAAGRTRTAHLDAFGMASGAMLILPQP